MSSYSSKDVLEYCDTASAVTYQCTVSGKGNKLMEKNSL